MNNFKSTTIISSAWAACFAVTVFCLCFFVSPAVEVAHQEGTKRVAACVENGGTWIELGGNCIAK